MNDHPYAKLMKNAWDAVARGDREGLAQTCAPDYCWHDVGQGPRAGDYRGIGAAIDYLASVGEDVEDLSFEMLDVMVGEHSVAVHFRLSGERKGKQLDMGYLMLSRVADDRLQETWSIPFDPQVVARFWS